MRKSVSETAAAMQRRSDIAGGQDLPGGRRDTAGGHLFGGRVDTSGGGLSGARVDTGGGGLFRGRAVTVGEDSFGRRIAMGMGLGAAVTPLSPTRMRAMPNKAAQVS